MEIEENKNGFLRFVHALKRDLRQIRRYPLIHLLLLPGLAFFVIFRYGPMWGVLMAFQDFNPFFGMRNSEWVGLEHFARFFSNPSFFMLLRNTFMLSFYNLILFFPIPIILALMLNDVGKTGFRRAIQSIIYLPNFISWVVVVGMVHVLFSQHGGIINQIILHFGGTELDLLVNPNTFRLFYTAQVIWKEAGWGTIIFLAALSGVDQEMYEAAYIDGASRLQRMWFITLPSIRSTIVLLLILRMGNFLDTGFEHLFLLTNPMTRSVAEVFDTYVYFSGIVAANFSYSTAVGLFKSLVGLVLVLSADRIAKKFGEDGVY